MSSPYQRARIWHMRAQSHWQFAQLIASHGENGGQCHITPDLFVLARPTSTSWDDNLVSNPMEVAENPDCWHVWLLAGDIATALKLMPYPLPFVSWHRRDKLRVHAVGDVLRHFVR